MVRLVYILLLTIIVTHLVSDKICHSKTCIYLFLVLSISKSNEKNKVGIRECVKRRGDIFAKILEISFV